MKESSLQETSSELYRLHTCAVRQQLHVVGPRCNIGWFKLPGHSISVQPGSDIILGLHARSSAKQARCEALAAKLDDQHAQQV